ncbi:MAG TPA: hypothetical protein VE710_01615, partial [Candidatus Bathyarchaeia archaeon]|nr:hypothetical protein [Candidatus Bathyarchaeia archaeon]
FFRNIHHLRAILFIKMRQLIAHVILHFPGVAHYSYDKPAIKINQSAKSVNNDQASLAAIPGYDIVGTRMEIKQRGENFS